MRQLGQSNINTTLDFGPRPAKKQTNVPLPKRGYELTFIEYLLCLWAKMIVAVFSGNNRKYICIVSFLLFQGVFHNWTLKVIEWFPPVHQPNEPMRPKEFLTIKLLNISETIKKMRNTSATFFCIIVIGTRLMLNLKMTRFNSLCFLEIKANPKQT